MSLCGGILDYYQLVIVNLVEVRCDYHLMQGRPDSNQPKVIVPICGGELSNYGSGLQGEL